MTDLQNLSDADFQKLYSQGRGDPTQLTDSELASALAKVRAGDRSLSEKTVDFIRSINTGLGRLLAGTAALPHTITEGTQALQEKQRAALEEASGRKLAPLPGDRYGSQWPSYDEMMRKIEASQGPLYQPQNEWEKVGATAGEFLPGAVMPGGLIAKAARVAIPTATTEVGERITKDTPLEPYGRAVGAMIGGGAQGGAEALLSRPRTAEQILAQQLPLGTTRQHIDEAERLMTFAQSQGTPLTWAEALSMVQRRPVLSDTVRHLEASSASGPRMAEFYADRPQGVAAAVGRQAQELSPGPPTDPYTLGPQVQEAAGTAVNTERQAINARADPYYYLSSFQNASPQEMNYLRSLPGWNDAVAAVRANPQVSRFVRNINDESNLAFLNEVKQQMHAQADAAVQPIRADGRVPSPKEQSGWLADEAAVRDAAIRASVAATQATNPGQAFAPYPTALAIEQAGRQRVLEPLMRGPLGQIMKADPEIASSVNILFPRQADKIHGEDAVGDAVRRIGQVSPKLAEDVVRAHLELAFNKAGEQLQSGPNQASGARLNVLMRASEQQRRNLQAAVEALPNGAQRWEGLNRLLDVFEAQGTRLNVGSRTAYNVEALRDFGPSGVIKDMAKVVSNPLSGAMPFYDRYARWKLGQNLDDLARIVTDPGSGNLLRQIAASPRGGQREANAIRALVYSQQLPQARGQANE